MSMGDIRFLEILLSPAATAAQRPPAGGHGFCPEMNACGQKNGPLRRSQPADKLRRLAGAQRSFHSPGRLPGVDKRRDAVIIGRSLPARMQATPESPAEQGVAE